ncbi:S-layer homology domain-containing protein [Sporosarcina cascadiensis]|uniref:S-layer homology domain-containing protein n=1 Tax=Sporosarcina cascadiensis TaxID=2660747 RepID=UPI00129B34B7|nr:S-layer homology domain-containing protein [Sporosarcina cascadiensis]
MKKQSISYVLLAFALVLQLAVIPLQTAAAEPDKSPTWIAPVNYLALGDSLAFGINSDGKPGKGYADFLTEELMKQEVLQTSNKGFSFPGYTSGDVLKDLQTDVTKPVLGTGPQDSTATLHRSIQEANLITLSAGANDVLPYFKIDEKTGKPSFNMGEIQAALMQTGKNTQQILAKIYELNPKAQVYVMGYYNSFPHLPADLQPQIALLMKGLNDAIQSGMQGTPAHFVKTDELIAKDFQTYLPNPANIHLSEAGYRVVAAAFHEALTANYPWYEKDALTAEKKDDSTVVLNWKPVMDTGMIMTYKVYNGDKMVGEVISPVLTYEITDLLPNQEYKFTVEAIDQYGKKSMHNLATVYTLENEPTEPSVMFTDIQDSWAKDFIEAAAANGIMGGYQDHTFRPGKSLTRAQATSVIVRALQLKPKSSNMKFDDLAYYADSTKADIQAAYDYGLMKGVNGHFMPNKPITRAQLALLLSRAYETAKGTPYKPAAAAPFKDIQNFSKDTQWAIAGLYEMNIAAGDQGKFMPNDPTTRAHAAKMIVQSMKVMGH